MARTTTTTTEDAAVEAEMAAAVEVEMAAETDAAFFARMDREDDQAARLRAIRAEYDDLERLARF